MIPYAFCTQLNNKPYIS